MTLKKINNLNKRLNTVAQTNFIHRSFVGSIPTLSHVTFSHNCMKKKTTEILTDIADDMLASQYLLQIMLIAISNC
jgi:hypothetical protein